MEQKEYKLLKAMIEEIILDDLTDYSELCVIAAFRDKEYLSVIEKYRGLLARFINGYKRNKYSCTVHLCNHEDNRPFRDALIERLENMESSKMEVKR